MEKARVIECRAEDITPEVLDEVSAIFSGRTRDKTTTSDGVTAESDVVRGGCFFRVHEDGEPVAWYVLGFTQEAGGVIATVRLAHGRAGFDLVSHVLPLIERQCEGCASLRIETRRPGLIRKLSRAGYRATSVTMRKKL
ncbi:hypothetical protein OYT13_11430 [Pandoraea sp. XJJ-1]|uniref:hypothetical protein n=1 Tax=Pandoraea sp. XJJ-1 TaxID=3002643 RepID=UPI0022829288|nr:hypothetical protein [Pandoraea sp. XJJ-1]WAL84958.1 hypothetical protein OYT13_11430 [Pandoraea sp. XJJ-1]